jgi:hypothetical protein
MAESPVKTVADFVRAHAASLASHYKEASHDFYFRGLVAAKLGPTEQLDDEILDGVVSNRIFADLCDELCNTGLGRDRLSLGIGSLELTESLDGAPGQEAAIRALRHQLWREATSDPRFDLILKHTLDDLRFSPDSEEPPLFWSILEFFGKIAEKAGVPSEKKDATASVALILLTAFIGGLATHAYDTGRGRAAGDGLPRQTEMSQRIDQLQQDLRDLRESNRRTTTETTASLIDLKKVDSTQYESLIRDIQEQKITNIDLTKIENSLTAIASALPSSKPGENAVQLSNVEGSLATIAGALTSNGLQQTASDAKKGNISMRTPLPIDRSLDNMQSVLSGFDQRLTRISSKVTDFEKYYEPQPFLFTVDITNEHKSVTLSRAAPLNPVPGTACTAKFGYLSGTQTQLDLDVELTTCNGSQITSIQHFSVGSQKRAVPNTDIQLLFEQPTANVTRHLPWKPRTIVGATVAVYGQDGWKIK